MRSISNGNKVYHYNEQENKLGSGAFADVFKGIKQGTNEQVAIKVIKKAVMQKYGDDIIKAIGSEVNILQKISMMGNSDPCPFIVKIFDCFETQNHIYIVLEYCNQGNLLELTKKRKKENNKLTEKEAIFIIYQVVQAIAYLSKYDITHRDIKPENIFISNGVYKLGDFGFASQKGLYSTTLGTYPYMAPEFFIEQSYNKSIDVWAVGVMYHELLFNELYFIGTSTYDVSKKIIEKPYIIQNPQLISQQSQDLLTRCIQKSPQQRITAEQAAQHQLFNEVKKDPQILKLFQTQSDVILEQIQQIRNGCLFLYELGEILERDNVKDFKFEMYYLYKKGIKNILELGDRLAKKEIPQHCYASQEDWNQFIKSQQYSNCITFLNNDRQVLTQKFVQISGLMNSFIQQNYPNEAYSIAQIINEQIDIEIPEQLYKEQIQSAFTEFFNKFQQCPDKSSDQARNYLLIAFMFSIAIDIDSVLKTKSINFEVLQREKMSYSINDIINKIEQFRTQF